MVIATRHLVASPSGHAINEYEDPISIVAIRRFIAQGHKYRELTSILVTGTSRVCIDWLSRSTRGNNLYAVLRMPKVKGRSHGD